MVSFLFVFLAFQPTSVIHLTEELVYEVEGLPAEKVTRQIYIGPNQVRTDFSEEHLSLLYDLNLGTLIVVNSDTKTYYLSRPGRDKEMSRSPLVRFVTQTDGMLTLSGPIATATGRKAIISGSECSEFLMNPRSSTGTYLTIWATDRQLRDRNEFKKVWYAACGTKPPQDVKDVFHRIFRDLKGAPVRMVWETEQEGFTIVATSTFTFINRNFQPEPRFFEIPAHFEIAQEGTAAGERPWHN